MSWTRSSTQLCEKSENQLWQDLLNPRKYATEDGGISAHL